MGENRRIAAILILALLLVSLLAGVVSIWRGSAAYAGGKIYPSAHAPASDGEDNGIERAQLADR